MKIIIFDRHPVMAHGLCQHFKYILDVEVVGHYMDEHDFLEQIKDKSDLLIIMDYLESKIGITLLEKTISAAPDSRVILFTSGNSDYIHSIVDKLVNVSIVNKKNTLEDLEKEVLQYMTKPSLKRQFPEHSLSVPKLTNKEKEIVRLLSKGYSSRDMSAITKTSFHTINNQKKHLIAKFQCNNSTEMLYKMVNLGYLPH